jgi:hypothetical protein
MQQAGGERLARCGVTCLALAALLLREPMLGVAARDEQGGERDGEPGEHGGAVRAPGGEVSE